VGIDDIVRALQDAGHPIGTTACTFLREFGMLRIYDISDDVVPGFRMFINIDPADAISIDVGYTSVYEQAVRKSLTPVGTARNRHTVMIISDDGEFYEGAEARLWKIGDSAHEAFNTLCNRSAATEIVMPD
jgi:hypothetical protein